MYRPYIYKYMKKFIFIFSLSLVSIAAHSDVVKKSNSGICHSEDSPYYEKTKKFTPYDTLDACLSSGGTLPKGYKKANKNISQKNENMATVNTNRVAHDHTAASEYDRSQFEHWIDKDHNCLNTRQELLKKLSTSTVKMSESHCTVSYGKWLDPYTGKTFYNSHDLDVDHLVPLKWAWEHGANLWSANKRRDFANDEINLFAVQASVNREKGALGPLDWLPPNESFRCQYVVRFIRVEKTYQLSLSDNEDRDLNALRQKLCAQ